MKSEPNRHTHERYFKSAAETTNDGVVFVDNAGFVRYFNSALCDLTGHSPDDISGKQITEIIGINNKSSMPQWESLSVDAMQNQLIDIYDKYDKKITCVISISPLRNSNIQYDGYFVILKNISESLQNTTQIEKLSSIVEQMSIGVLITDKQGIIEYVNPKFCNLSGYSSADIIGKNPRILKSGYTDPNIYRIIWESLLKGEEYETIIQDKNKSGEFYWVKAKYFSIKNEEGSIVYLVALQEDITDKKQTELALAESSSRLKSVSKQLLTIQEQERKRVAGEMHDGIGQYLNAIKFGLQQMDAELKDIKSVDSNYIAELILMAQEAIDEVRRISSDLRPAILDDLGLLSTINWFCRRFLQTYTGLQITRDTLVEESEIPEDLKIVIFRIIQEAFTNAAKHANADTLTLSLSTHDSQLELVLSDNGRGFNLEQATDNESPTRGFGLVSMRERVQLSGGEYCMLSTQGQGTTIKAKWTL